jgi:hypothetical protein
MGQVEQISNSEEMRNAYKILLRKSDSLISPGRHTHKWKNNTKIALTPCMP